MVNWLGFSSLIIFYLLILGIGVFAAWRRRNVAKGDNDVILAGRDIGPFLGLWTMIATWVGGGFINGTAEITYTSGLLYCQAPIGYAISLGLGGIFFAKKMREAEYTTMLDPLQNCFGRHWGSMLYLPALMGELLWSASILAALGSTLYVILGLSDAVSIIVSAAIAICYTLVGGLYSVAFTDVIQLGCIVIGLWLAVPFAMMNEHSTFLNQTDPTEWLGKAPENVEEWGAWWDYAFLLMLGGIPWQVYFQRVLSSRTPRQAQFLSIGASVGCIVMSIPAILIGAVARSTDWESSSFNGSIIAQEKEKLVLPLVLQHLTPPWVSFIGLGAVSAAVMSSADSSVLSAASMFAHNIYGGIIRPKASPQELTLVLRCVVPVIGAIACIIAIFTNSIYYLFYLCGDFVYVMLFPQLTMAVHFPSHVNRIGSICAYVVGFVIRIVGGEKGIGLPALIKFPWYDYQNQKQNFPFRSLAMVLTFLTLVIVSRLSRKYNSRQQNVEITSFTEKKNKMVDTTEEKGVDNYAMKDI